VDVSGRWTGVWSGYGSSMLDRKDSAEADFTQSGATGTGRLYLYNILTTDAHRALRRAGANGVSVVIQVSGSNLNVKHELGEEHFTAQFTAKGDQLVGSLEGLDIPVKITLERAKAETPAMQIKKAQEEQQKLIDSKLAAVRALADQASGGAEAAAAAAREAAAKADQAAGKADEALATAEETETRLDRFLAARYKRNLVETVVATFSFDKSDLDAQGQAALTELVKKLAENPNLVVDLGGHTDSRGSDRYNLALSERRKETVRRFLVEKGVDLNRIFSIGWGEFKAIADNKSEQGRTANRRVAIGIFAPAE
jgi:outer membrane protein OmpA-like peptidoglycan-associated protein